MKENIFSSKLTLSFQNKNYEDEYIANKIRRTKSFNKIFFFISFFIALTDSIYNILTWNYKIKYEFYGNVYYLSFIITGSHLVLFPLLFVKTPKVQNFLKYIYYIITTFPLYNTRVGLMYFEQANYNVYTILFCFEIIGRFSIILSNLINHLETITIHIIIILSNMIYVNIVDNSDELNSLSLAYCIILLNMPLISYVYTRIINIILL
jgi:hypothetical protein